MVISHLDWGSVPVWVGTLIGSTTAVLAVTSYRRNLYDKEREQAAKISCWIAEPPIIIKIERLSKGHYLAVGLIGVKVANRSDGPVYDVEVFLPGSNGETLEGIELPPGVIATGEKELSIPFVQKGSSDEEQIKRITIGAPTLTLPMRSADGGVNAKAAFDAQGQESSPMPYLCRTIGLRTQIKTANTLTE